MVSFNNTTYLYIGMYFLWTGMLQGIQVIGYGLWLFASEIFRRVLGVWYPLEIQVRRCTNRVSRSRRPEYTEHHDLILFPIVALSWPLLLPLNYTYNLVWRDNLAPATNLHQSCYMSYHPTVQTQYLLIRTPDSRHDAETALTIIDSHK